MAVRPEYRDYVLEQLGRVIPVAGRAMFGGVGIYSHGLFFALISGDSLYLKVDGSNRPDFERVGARVFRPFPDGRSLNYYELPGELLEDTEELALWVSKALEAARSASRRRGGDSHTPHS